MNNHDGHHGTASPEPQLPQEMRYAGALALDVDKYRKYVDHLDLSEERKIELLQTLWSIMTAFVQWGFGLDSTQRHIPALAEISPLPESTELTDSIPTERRSSASEEGAIDTD